MTPMKPYAEIISSSVLFVLSCAVAEANCTKERLRFFVDRDGTYKSRWELSGNKKTCGNSYRAGGRATFHGLKVLVHPQHGRLEPYGAYSTIAFRYRRKPGFVGEDFFVTQICGESLGQKGCARLEYTVSVR
jgi:hypothetical protein